MSHPPGTLGTVRFFDVLVVVLVGLGAAMLVAAAVAVAAGAVVARTARAAERRLAAGLQTERALGRGDLAADKARIEAQLHQVAGRLGEFERTVREIDGRQREQLGSLATSLRSLTQTTDQLRDVLASAQARGQWGERMADDVLRVAGFVEGINYRKRKAVPAGTIPDFTFLLPNDLLLHMDVKFPLDNYVRFLGAATDAERQQYRRAFLRDVRDRVKELGGRGYLEARDSTVECLLLFVPNEGLYTFVQQEAPALLDDALAHGIVVCSPLTLFAILRVVRQAVDHFRLERTTSEILGLLGEFEVQWGKYGERLDKLARSFATVQRDLDDLLSTRTRQLQRPLDRIAALRQLHGAPEAARAAGSGAPPLRAVGAEVPGVG